MKNHFKIWSVAVALIAMLASSCQKTEYSFGELKTPSDFTLTTAVTGASTALPDGNGSGEVEINLSSANAITYKVDFGDGNTQLVPSGNIKYKYSSPGTFEYTVTASAVGTGGITSVLSKKIKVFVAFEIPDFIVDALTGGTSKIWVTDKESGGHVGVGPADGFTDSYYSAPPNVRDACLYDDEVTFSKEGNDIFISVDNKGESSLIAAATAFYGFSGPDGCYPVTTAKQKLSFMDANTGSSASNSTQIQFKVPGNGIVNFGTGGSTYEILKITENTIHLRNIGADGLAWYQKLKVK
ncbi:PKD domain-containing protein [Pelobium manganitolerans]|uniref:PKD domain-containing protein n=1 Tax=Pelobium manganitolerans TaxID=1842495 RepID=UPI003FA3C9B3